MFLLEPEPTPMDLSWRMFGVHVRVHPFFWLFTGLLGLRTLEMGIQYLLLWIACAFGSILIHELGHVMVGRVFGSFGNIVLYGFGGLAIGASALNNRWQRIAVYLAGPFAEFILFAIVAVAFIYYAQSADIPPLAWAFIEYMFVINLFWGALNLVPVWPLDGGQVSRELFQWLLPSNGLRISLVISLVMAAILAGAALFFFRSIFMGLFFGSLAFSSFQMMQQLPRDRSWDDEERHEPWQRDPDWWKRGR